MESTETTNSQESKTYTQDEVNKMIQSESDKRVSEALKTQERKNQARLEEAQKLASMDAQQKYEYEIQKREQALAEREQALAMAEQKATAAQILGEKNIPQNLLTLVVAADAETTMQNISLLEENFNKAVQAEVEKRLSTSTPTKSISQEGTLTKEGFKNMSLSEQAQLYTTNPSLYQQLTT